MEVRYTGPLTGGVTVDYDDENGSAVSVEAARMEWVDLPTDMARSLAEQDVWELRGDQRGTRTRRAREDGPRTEGGMVTGDGSGEPLPSIEDEEN